MKFSLASVFLLAAAIAIVCGAYSTYQDSNGRHLHTSIELPDGTVLDLVADNAPDWIHRYGRSSSPMYGRHFSIYCSRNVANVNGYSDIVIQGEFDSLCCSFIVPEGCYDDLEFEVVCDESETKLALVEQGFPHSVLLVYSTEHQTFVAPLCPSGVCLGQRHCVSRTLPAPQRRIADSVIESLRTEDSRYHFITCHEHWHHTSN